MRTLADTLDHIQDKKRLGLMTHVVVGYPTLDDTYDLIACMVEAGVDCIELQIPFSDPLADGSTIMHASEEALAGGVTPHDCMEFMRRVSAKFDISFLFMSYFNIVHSYGTEQFVKDAKAAGAAGCIVPDAMPDTPDGAHLYEAASAHDFSLVTVLAPHNTPDRLAELKAHAQTLVYLPLHKGVTGARSDMSAALREEIALIREHLGVPVVVGFGISKPEHIATVRETGAEMVVVGSALIDVFREQGVVGVRTFLAEITAAL